MNLKGRARCFACVAEFSFVYLALEIIVRVILLAGIFITRLKTPFKRQVFNWNDYRYPYYENTFSVLVTALLVVAVALLYIVIWAVIMRYYQKKSSGGIVTEVVYSIMSFTLCIESTLLVTEMIKRYYGRLRPDYLARCLGAERFGDSIPPMPACTNSDTHSIEDGRMSFPSGHAANSWAGLLFAALYSYSKLSEIPHVGSIRFVVPFGTLLLSTMISVTRSSDYRHHPSDIVAGTLLGIIIAIITYRLYFPLRFSPIAVQQFTHRNEIQGQFDLTVGKVELTPEGTPV